MASSRGVEKLLLNIRADLKDLKNLQLELETVRKKGKEVETGISEGIKNALGTLGASFTTLKIKGVFDGAVADANRLEKTMLGLQATAKLTGNSFAQIKSAVNNLSKDGVLSIDQASQSMKVLLAQGVAADKAFQLVDAAKKVGAFNNIVGDTGQAVQDFIKFLQTGSAELAENLDPSLVKVIKSLGGYEAVANNAAAKQKLINAVIEKGTALTGDYEKFLQSGSQAAVTYGKAQERLSQNFGEKLAPAYSEILSLGAKLIGGIADIIKRFSSFSVSVIAFSVLGIAALVSIGGAVVAFSSVTKAAMLSILGPIAAIVAALASIVAIAYELTYVKSTREIAEEYKKQKEEVNGLATSITNLSKIRDRTVSQEKELRDSLEQLREKLKAAGIDYDALAAKTKNYTDFAKAATSELRTKKSEEINKQINDTEREIKSLEDLVRATEQYSVQHNVPLNEYTRITVNGQPQYGMPNYVETRANIQKKREKLAGQALDQAVVLTEEDNKSSAVASNVSAGKEARFLETRKKLEEIAQNERYTITAAMSAKIDAAEKTRRIENAKRDAQFQREEAINSLKQAYAEFTEDKYAQDRLALEKSTNDARRASEGWTETQIQKIQNVRARDLALYAGNATAIEAIDEIAEAKLYEIKKANLDRLGKIREEKAKKEAKLYVDSLNDTLQGGAAFAKGLQQIRSGDAAGGLAGSGAGLDSIGKGLAKSGFIEAGGTASSIFGAFGVAGGIAGAFGSISSGLSGLFDKSDAQRAQEAEEQKQVLQNQVELLAIQNNYTKSILALQEAAAKQPFEELTRNLRLIDINAQKQTILGGDPATIEQSRQKARLAAMQDTLTSQAGTISGGELFGNVGATPDELIAFLNKSTALRNQLGPLIALAQSGKTYKQTNYYSNGGQDTTGIFRQFQEELARLGYQDEDYRIGAVRYAKLSDTQKASIQGLINQGYSAPLGISQQSIGYAPKITEIDKLVTAALEQASLSSIGNQSLNQLLTEYNIDTSVAESTLSVIEQTQQTQLDIAAYSKSTAENTSKLTQLDDRKVSYLDLGEKRVISKGFNVSVDRLKLPDSVASTVLASSASPSVPSDTLAAFRKMIELAEESNDYLAMIAANTDSKASTNTDDFETRLVAKLLELKGRRVAA